MDSLLGGDPLGIDLLAPLGSVPVLDDLTALGAPGTGGAAVDPPTMVLRNLGESESTGVTTSSEIEALGRTPRPGDKIGPAVLGVVILAGLGGLAVRHRVLGRRTPRPAPRPGPRHRRS